METVSRAFDGTLDPRALTRIMEDGGSREIVSLFRQTVTHTKHRESVCDG
jgi:hypothetical protein